MVLGFIQNFVAEKFVVIGKVCHSQKLNNLLVSSWIISQRNGKIQSADGWLGKVNAVHISPVSSFILRPSTECQVHLRAPS